MFCTIIKDVEKMSMHYEELDGKTREYMLTEFETEQKNNPYLSKALSKKGLEVFPELMRKAIKNGNETTLFQSLDNHDYWLPTELYTRVGITRERRRNISQSAQRLALTEFNTWYVRGFSKRLMDEGEKDCQIYRGEIPKWEPGECEKHEGRIIPVKEIYNSHRARYWPEPGDLTIFSIPWGPGCHHVIRRVNTD